MSHGHARHASVSTRRLTTKLPVALGVVCALIATVLMTPTSSAAAIVNNYVLGAEQLTLHSGSSFPETINTDPLVILSFGASDRLTSDFGNALTLDHPLFLNLSLNTADVGRTFKALLDSYHPEMAPAAARLTDGVSNFTVLETDYRWGLPGSLGSASSTGRDGYTEGGFVGPPSSSRPADFAGDTLVEVDLHVDALTHDLHSATGLITVSFIGTPEPSGLAVIVLLGISLMARRHVRRREMV